MEKKFTGIVLSVSDYREKDSIITLLTAEQGIINVAVQNPKDENDTFVFSKVLFTFGYFTVKVLGDLYYDLRKCEIIDTFENIKNNKEKRIEGTNLLLLAKEFAQFEEQCANLLQELLLSLKTINYNENNCYFPNFVLTKFLIYLLNILTDFRATTLCKVCGEELKQNILFYDLQKNAFTCINCQSKNSIVFNKKDVEILHFALDNKYNANHNFSGNNLSFLLAKLLKIFKFNVSERFKFYCE